MIPPRQSDEFQYVPLSHMHSQYFRLKISRQIKFEQLKSLFILVSAFIQRSIQNVDIKSGDAQK